MTAREKVIGSKTVVR